MSHYAINALITFLDKEVIRLDRFDMLAIKPYMTVDVAKATISMSYKVTISGARSITLGLDNGTDVVIALPTKEDKIVAANKHAAIWG